MSLRASYSGIWSNCPASVHLPRLETENPAALEGSAVHELAYRMATLNLDRDGIEIPVTAAITDAAQGFVEYCKSLNCDQTAYENTFRRAEILPGVGGTPDFIGYQELSATLHVVDLKYGHSPVSPRKNTQLLLYSMGAANFFDVRSQVQTIVFHVYQPRDYVNGTEKSWKIPRGGWGQLCVDIEIQAERTRTEKTAITGPHCRYCKSRIYCPAFLKVSGDVLATVVTSPELVDLSPEAVSAEYEYLLQAELLVVSARKGFEELIKARIADNKPIPGWAMGRTNGRDRWDADTKGTLRGMSELFNVPLLEEKPISVKEARKYKEISILLEPLISKGAGNPKLIRFDKEKIEEIFKWKKC